MEEKILGEICVYNNVFRTKYVFINTYFALSKTVFIKTDFDLNRGALNTDLMRSSPAIAMPVAQPW
jgi:hypothetical protein